MSAAKTKPSIWAQAIAQAVKQKPHQANALAKKFLVLLGAKRQRKLLPQIVRQIEKLATADQIQITSAHELTSQQIAKIAQLARKTFRLEREPAPVVNLDSKLIGGFSVKSSDSELTLTIDNQLSQIGIKE